MNRLKELKELLNKKISTEKRLDTLREIAETLWMKAEFSEAKKYAEILLELSRISKEKSYEASANYLIGLMNAYLNNYDGALEYQYKALKLHQETNMKDSIAEDFNNIGNIYLKMNNYEKALDSFLEAQKIIPDSARTFNNLCHIYNQLQQYDKALEYARKALEYSSEEKSSHPDRARTNIFSYINLGEIFLNQQKCDKAIKELKRAYELAKGRIDDTPIITNYYLGIAYKRQGDLQKAKETLLRSMKLCQHHENKEYLIEIYKTLFEIYEANNDLPQALDYLKKYVQLDKKIYTDRMAERLAKTQAFYEVETNALKAQQMSEKVSKLASLGVMAAGITHEINQPLCAIKVSAESILYWNRKHNQILPENFTEALQDISEAADHIDDIIKHMRAFWKMPAVDTSETININSAIKNSLTLIERQIYSHGIFLELDLCEKDLFIEINPIHFEQIIINIVVNAMQSLDEKDDLEKRIVISTSRKNGQVQASISDNGIGLPSNIGQRIFDPFFSTKHEDKGMGLGLAIVKNYLDKYKAEISADQNEWGGAIFKISFKEIKHKE